MQRLTDERPKCLVELRGTPLLDLQLQACGPRASRKSPSSPATSGNCWEPGPDGIQQPALAQTNMVSSLACAEPWLLAGTCIVSYGDIFYDSSAVQLLLNCQAPLAVTYDGNCWPRGVSASTIPGRCGDIPPQAGWCLKRDRQQTRFDRRDRGQYMGLLRFTPAACGK